MGIMKNILNIFKINKNIEKTENNYSEFVRVSGPTNNNFTELIDNINKQRKQTQKLIDGICSLSINQYIELDNFVVKINNNTKPADFDCGEKYNTHGEMLPKKFFGNELRFRFINKTTNESVTKCSEHVFVHDTLSIFFDSIDNELIMSIEDEYFKHHDFVVVKRDEKSFEFYPREMYIYDIIKDRKYNNNTNKILDVMMTMRLKELIRYKDEIIASIEDEKYDIKDLELATMMAE